MVEEEVPQAEPVASKAREAGVDKMFAALYEDLHRMAVRELRKNSGAPLSPTTLIHETFLNGSVREFAELSDRGRFMIYAARAMRGLIIDSLRRGDAKKRGSEFEFIPLPEELPHTADGDLDVDRLTDALDALVQINPRLAECVDLKFFCGFSFVDIAELWGVSERTVLRDWEKARLLLNRLMNGTVQDGGSGIAPTVP